MIDNLFCKLNDFTQAERETILGYRNKQDRNPLKVAMLLYTLSFKSNRYDNSEEKYQVQTCLCLAIKKYIEATSFECLNEMGKDIGLMVSQLVILGNTDLARVLVNKINSQTLADQEGLFAPKADQILKILEKLKQNQVYPSGGADLDQINRLIEYFASISGKQNSSQAISQLVITGIQSAKPDFNMDVRSQMRMRI